MTTGDAAYWQARAETLASRVQELEGQLSREEEHSAALKDQRDRWYGKALSRVCALAEMDRLVQSPEYTPDVLGAAQMVLAQHAATPTFREFVEAAIAVARLNFDMDDAIRPMRNGASDAFHRLENALVKGEFADLPESDYLTRVRAHVAGKRVDD